MSPALLSKRLKDLEAAGIVMHISAEREAGVLEYRLTEAGSELRPIIEAIGVWGHRWVTTEATLKNLDANLLMWDIRRNINADPMPPCRNVIEFIFNDRPLLERNYWLIVEPGHDVDLCLVSPGFDVDLYVSTELRTLTEVWLGYVTIDSVLEDERLVLIGNARLGANLRMWLKLSIFAKLEKKVA
jgi:hypothetical protein